MCFGDLSDTLHRFELDDLREAGRRCLPGYVFSVHANDAISWVVLSPPDPRRLPRFTICRIAPCIMVMVEADGEPRRFASTPDVEGAIGFAGHVVEQTVLALHNIHEPAEMMQ